MASILQLTRVEQTRSATETYLRDVLDPMIDEVQDQLQLLLGQRRALAITMQVDRPRDDASNVTKMIAAASRSTYEGDENRRTQTRRYTEADVVVTHSGKVLKNRFGPEDELNVLVVPDDDPSLRLIPRPKEGT